MTTCRYDFWESMRLLLYGIIVVSNTGALVPGRVEEPSLRLVRQQLQTSSLPCGLIEFPLLRRALPRSILASFYPYLLKYRHPAYQGSPRSVT